jgi:hypothetical protein
MFAVAPHRVVGQLDSHVGLQVPMTYVLFTRFDSFLRVRNGNKCRPLSDATRQNQLTNSMELSTTREATRC